MQTKISDTVTKVELEGREIYLVGTAHVSRESVDEVDRVIREYTPDNVCIELDEQRFKSIKDKDKWSKLDIAQVIKSKQSFLMLGNLVLASSQKRMGLDMGVKPGEEMIQAINVCEELDVPFTFADRPIQVTLRRAWGLSSLWGKAKLMSALLSFAFSNEKISEDELEEMKKTSATHNVMNEVSEYLPAAKNVLIDERDQYLASKIFNADGKKIVAIVGAGHVPGILTWLKDYEEDAKSTDIDSISHVPPGGKMGKIIAWMFPIAIIAGLVYGFINNGPEGGLDGLISWVGWNGGLSSLGALLGFAHPVSILVAFVAAPITSLYPLLGAGMVVGLVETFFRRPRIQDLEHVTDDVSSLKGIYKNRFLRILLIFILSSLGSTIGTISGAAWIRDSIAGAGISIWNAVSGFFMGLFGG